MTVQCDRLILRHLSNLVFHAKEDSQGVHLEYLLKGLRVHLLEHCQRSGDAGGVAATIQYSHSACMAMMAGAISYAA